MEGAAVVGTVAAAVVEGGTAVVTAGSDVDEREEVVGADAVAAPHAVRATLQQAAKTAILVAGAFICPPRDERRPIPMCGGAIFS